MKVCLACSNRFDAGGWRCPACSTEPPLVDGYRAFAPELAAEFDGFEAEFFGPLAEAEPNSFWFTARNALVVWAIRRYFREAQSLLEIGCGTGFVLQGIRAAFPHLRLTASEALTSGFRWAAERVPDAELLQMDGRRIPFAEEFDVVGAFDVIEHIEDDAAVLKQMHAATRTGGGIVLTVPQHPRLWSVADDIAHHKRRYTRRELITKVRAAGFDVLRATSFVSLLLPAMLAARAGKKEREDFDAMSEHSFSRPVDRALRGVMAVERMLIAAGISLPAGGSLLLVARKGAAG